MPVGQLRSRTGCLTCKKRRKKCDETRPVCERCTKAGMQCLGYLYPEAGGKASRSGLADRMHSDTDTSLLAVASSSQIDGDSYLMTALTPPGYLELQSTGDSTDMAWPSLSIDQQGCGTIASNITPVPGDWTDIDPLVPPQQPNHITDSIPQSRQFFTGPTSDISQSSALGDFQSHQPDTSFGRVVEMTPGQADLFQTLLSLERAETSALATATASYPPPGFRRSGWSSLDTKQDETSPSLNNGSDVEGVRAVICGAPALGRNAPGDSLPFVLYNYSKLVSWIVFEPLLVANRARDYIISAFAQSESSRWRLIHMANAIQALTSASKLIESRPAVSLLRDQAQLQLARAAFGRNPSARPVSYEIADALFDVMEVANLQFLSNSVQANYSLIQETAPAYRRACLEPPNAPINLPHKLLHPEYPIRRFPFLDIIFSFATCTPMQFRYDVTYNPGLAYPSDVCFDNKDGRTVGLQWMTGVPDQFTVLLARMNMLRDDCAPNVDPEIVSAIEDEIRNFQPTLSMSPDPFLTVVRLGVQEAWRQTLYIYLYMGLCGASSNDERVKQALRRFVRLLDGIKPGHNPDSFLILPMIVAGIASIKQRDRETIRRRLLRLHQCSQPGVCGYEAVVMVQELWARTDAEARPATWWDWKIAVTTITGVE